MAGAAVGVGGRGGGLHAVVQEARWRIMYSGWHCRVRPVGRMPPLMASRIRPLCPGPLRPAPQKSGRSLSAETSHFMQTYGASSLVRGLVSAECVGGAGAGRGRGTVGQGLGAVGLGAVGLVRETAS